MKNHKSACALIGIMSIIVCMAASGCSSLTGQTGYDTQKGAPAGVPAPRHLSGVPDIRLPDEMSLDPKNTSMFESNGFAAGILSFSGKVSTNSLSGFFRENMVRRDGWVLIGTITAPRTVMLFQKGARWCVIRITETTFTTHAEVTILPSGGPAPAAPAAAGAEPGAAESGDAIYQQAIE